MAGFQLPITAYTQQQLAEMAQRAFRPPALMGGGGGGMQMPQSQGFNVGQDLAGMGQGLGMLAGQLGKGRGIDAEIKDWSGYGSPAGRASLDQLMAANAAGGSAIPVNPSLSYGGPRAGGGEVTPGQYYTVGERGPETFVPAVPGTIVPNEQLPGRMPDPTDPIYGRMPDPTPLIYGRMPDPELQHGRMPDWERDFFGGRRQRR